MNILYKQANTYRKEKGRENMVSRSWYIKLNGEQLQNFGRQKTEGESNGEILFWFLSNLQ